MIIFQAKTEASFRERALDTLSQTLRDLLDLSRPLPELAGSYKKELLAAAELFRDATTTLATRFPTHMFTLFYASRGVEIHPNVGSKAELLETMVKGQFPGAKCVMRFLTATDLLNMARQTPRSSHQLEVTDAPINTKGGIIGLVKIPRVFPIYLRRQR